MNIAIIDADLIGRKNHRFPNLASMKISGYHKQNGDNVQLKLDYRDIGNFDIVYISKVFTDTVIDDSILTLSNVIYGGTGFFFNQAPELPYEIEHCFPDYHLYDEWVTEQLKNPKNKKSNFKCYLDYSIGFLTRGCFRKCEFCVNKKYDKVFLHSPLNEFYDKDRKKIMLLDDNFLGCSEWKSLLFELIETNKLFVFKQGLDERLLTKEKCEILFNAKYDDDYIFAFDNIEDYNIIEEKLKLIRSTTQKQKITFYVLCGFTDTGLNDIVNTFERIKLLMKYECFPYIMRYQSPTSKPYLDSEFYGLYNTIAMWCNQRGIFKKMSLREFSKGRLSYGAKSDLERITKFEERYPEIAKKYFDIKFGEI